MIYIGWFVRIWQSSEETGSYRQEREEGEKNRRKQESEIAGGDGTGKKEQEDAKWEQREWCQRGEVSAKQEYLLMEEEQKANLYIAGQSQANLPQGSFKFSLWSYFCMRNVLSKRFIFWKWLAVFGCLSPFLCLHHKELLGSALKEHKPVTRCWSAHS